MDGWRDVALDGDRRSRRGSAGRRDRQAVQEITLPSALLRSEMLIKKKETYAVQTIY